jgi:hypothetical protein
MVAAFVAMVVNADARRRGLNPTQALRWGVGVFMLMAIFLPLYLLFRPKQVLAEGEVAKLETAPCPYCGYLNKPGANFCEKCSRQLKSSSEIHTR